MRLRDIIICFICIVLSAALLITAGMQLDFINSQRKEMKLIINEPLKNAPPSLAFATVAMGAFRGLVVDILWIRADQLKEQGQFFDAKQLAEWITILQPRFATVWEFQSWNMAYNISVAIPATQPHERWRWVKNGYELLRDKGISLNPKSILLYRQLALIFQHKIAGVTDDAHKYYKLQLASAMEPLLGPADNEYFKVLVEAPTQWKQITDDDDVALLIKSLKSADKAFADDDKFVNNYLALRQDPGRFDEDAFEIINRFRGTGALEKFDIFARSYHLRNVWKLDPVLMQQLNQTYGPVNFDDPNEHFPLDWRHANSHAIYWAVMGLQAAGKEELSIDETNTDRIVLHSLQALFRNGKIFIYDVPFVAPSDSSSQPSTPSDISAAMRKDIFTRPDLRMLEPYNKAVLAVLEKYKDMPKKGTYESLRIGHRNMLQSALTSFYYSGNVQQARKIYSQLRQRYPKEEFKVPLAVFIRNSIRKEVLRLGVNDVKEMVQMILQESYFRYAMHNDNEAYGREKMAREIYDLYQSMYSDRERIELPEFKRLRYFALVGFIDDRQYPFNLRRNLLGRIKLERPDLFEKLFKQAEEQFKQQQQTPE